jgi:hypothetical protein
MQGRCFQLPLPEGCVAREPDPKSAHRHRGCACGFQDGSSGKKPKEGAMLPSEVDDDGLVGTTVTVVN